MKNKGFTLIEVLIVMSILGIVMLMFAPLINSFLGAQERVYNQSKVDGRLSEIVDFIKRDVRKARTRSGNDPIEVFNETGDKITDGSKGVKVVIHGEDLDGVSRDIQYFIEGTELKLNTGGNNSILLTNVEEGSFKYKDKILLFHFKIKLPDKLDGKIRNEIRDIGITRVNIE
jgi:prepilin-type N-terminal cleavage/methylation domain-containing protein